MALEHERVDLVAQLANVLRECEDVLDGTVVEVEPEPHEPVLSRLRERAFPLGVSCEQVLTLEHRREGCRSLG